MLNKLLSLILLPIYTRFLTPADYGILAILIVMSNVAAVFAQLGLGSALFREVIYRETDEDTATSTALYFQIFVAIILFGILALSSHHLSLFVFGTESYSHLLRLVFITGLLTIVEVLFMTKVRIGERSVLYSVLSVSRFFIGALLNIYFVVVLQEGVAGLIKSGLITSALFSVIYLGLLLPNLKFKISIPLLRRMLFFGVPLVPAGLADLLMTSSDRYFLQYYSTTTEVGLYSLGYTIGLVINLIVWSVQLAWPPQMFSIAKQPNAEHKFSKLLTYYVAALGFLCLGISLLAREVLIVLATPEFYGAAIVVPLIAMSYLFYGIRFMTNTGLPTKNKMQYISPIIIGATLLNLGLNYAFIPSYGMMGAAWATLISYIVLTVVSMAVNLHFWYIPYEYGRLAKVAITWGLIFCCSIFIRPSSIWLGIFVKVLLLGAYPIILYMLHFYNRNEIDSLKSLLRKRTA